MLGLTLFKNFINNLKVGYYSAIKCHCFQAVKDKPEEIEKKKWNYRRFTNWAVNTQESDKWGFV